MQGIRMARPFITVASMPMWSPTTRFMPAFGQAGTTEQVAATDDQTDLNPPAQPAL